MVNKLLWQEWQKIPALAKTIHRRKDNPSSSQTTLF
jgi:hypothetical protein